MAIVKGKPHNTVQRKKDLIKALTKHLGLISYACEDANVSVKTYYLWLANDPEFKETVEQISEKQQDFVEKALITNIREGNASSIQFYLKTKGRKRGYQERQEIELSSKEIKFSFGDADLLTPDGE